MATIKTLDTIQWEWEIPLDSTFSFSYNARLFIAATLLMKLPVSQLFVALITCLLN